MVDKPETFVTIIVPAIMNSIATSRMKAAKLDYLGEANMGWKIIENIHKAIEPGQSAAKFKRIGMEHYLHCLREKINDGAF